MNKKKIAVIVPMYNVEEYVSEAIESVLDQQLSEDELQIILIDDGSQDDTLKIANELEKKYPNYIEVHAFKNSGLGAARNKGTEFANAEFIAYLDPDDLVVKNSYRTMLDTIERTGSDIITGNVRRFNSKKIWKPDLHSKAILGSFEHTSLDEHPELIWDASSWNKLYRLSFLKENNFKFPEGVLYEDFPMVNPAYAKANGIDVLNQVVYMWRAREGSITHQSTGIKATMDRIKVNQIALEGLKKYNASPRVIEELILKALNMGILAMLRKEKYELIPINDRKLLFKTLKEYLSEINEDYLHKVIYENFVFFNNTKNVKNFFEWDEFTLLYLRNGIQYSGYWDNNLYYLKNNVTSDIKKATKQDFIINSKVTDVHNENNQINISGWFFPKFSDMSALNLIRKAKVNLLNKNNEYLVKNIGNISFNYNHNITAKFGYNSTHFTLDKHDFNLDYANFEINIPIKQLDVFDNIDNVLVEIDVEIDGIRVKGYVGNPWKKQLNIWPEPFVFENGLVIKIDYSSNDWLMRLTLSKNEAVIKMIDDDTFEVANYLDRIYLVSGKQELPLNVFSSQVKLPLIVQNKLGNFEKKYQKEWKFVTKNNLVTKPMYFMGPRKQIKNDAYIETFDCKKGLAVLNVNWIYPFISDLKIINNVLYLTVKLVGWQNEASSVQVIPDPQISEIIWSTKKVSNDEYRLDIPLTLDGFGDKKWLNINIRLTFEDGYITNEPLRWGLYRSELIDKTVEISNVDWKFSYLKEYAFGGFAIQRTAKVLYKEEVGSFETFLENDYSKWLQEPLLENVVLWSAYWGRNNKFEGNPRALFEYVSSNYPQLNNVVVVQNKLRSYPELGNTKVISFGTKEYWYYQAKAKYFVNDVNWTDRNRRKRPEQIEIETMHGTPLKAMGFDVLDEWKDTTYYSYLRRFKNYDYLVVPSDFVSEYAQHAFKIHPKILKTGYPRNDVFFKNHTNLERKQIKIKYKLPIDKKIVLYTPTWRNQDKKHPTDINSLFNVKKMYESLNNNTVIVVKNHNFEKLTGIDKKYQDKIMFVNKEADIESLYIISDAVITDYSSVMFDYSLLDKPMIFWAFDYDEYVNTRGINFNLKDNAPGPFVNDEDELIQWINTFERIPQRFQSKIAAFKTKFGQYDVGTASEQIAQKIWGRKY